MPRTMTAPPATKIAKAFRLDLTEAKRIREALRYGRGLAVAFRGVPGFFGVETVVTVSGDVAFRHVNAGDTYAPTIVRRDGSTAYRISTVGDEVEAIERRGVRCA